jgi:hypothetical protein
MVMVNNKILFQEKESLDRKKIVFFGYFIYLIILILVIIIPIAMILPPNPKYFYLEILFFSSWILCIFSLLAFSDLIIDPYKIIIIYRDKIQMPITLIDKLFLRKKPFILKENIDRIVIVKKEIHSKIKGKIIVIDNNNIHYSTIIYKSLDTIKIIEKKLKEYYTEKLKDEL